MSAATISSVRSFNDIGSRLAAFSIAVSVPPSGRATYSFSLEWDKKRVHKPIKSKPNTVSPDQSELTVKDSVSTKTLSSAEYFGSDNREKLMKQAATLPPSRENTANDFVSKSTKNIDDYKHHRDTDSDSSKCKKRRSRKAKQRREHKPSRSFETKERKSKKSESNLSSDTYDNPCAPRDVASWIVSSNSHSQRACNTPKSRPSLVKLEDCNRLVDVRLYVRHFGSDGSPFESVFNGETINITTLLNALKFLLCNFKLPANEHTFGRLFVLRDGRYGNRVQELPYSTYRSLTLEEVEPQKDEHLFVLDLTDTFVDRLLPPAHQKPTLKQ